MLNSSFLHLNSIISFETTRDIFWAPVYHMLAQAPYLYYLKPTFLNRNPIYPWGATKRSCVLRAPAPWPISLGYSPCTVGSIRRFQAGQCLLEQAVFLSARVHDQRPNRSPHVYSALWPERTRSIEWSQCTKTRYFWSTYYITARQRSLLWWEPLGMDRTQLCLLFSSC